MLSHIKGAKHLKKTQADAERRANAGKKGIFIPEKLVKQIREAPGLAKKIPLRLSHKLRETIEPIVGLKYIAETISCTVVDAEPHYECLLCSNQGEANVILTHIMGRGHREKFLQKKFPDNPEYINIPKDKLLRETERLKENDDISGINTIYSDELYPWGPGKAPWSAEQGGTGFTPSGRDQIKERRRRLILGGDTYDLDGGHFWPQSDQGGQSSRHRRREKFKRARSLFARDVCSLRKGQGLPPPALNGWGPTDPRDPLSDGVYRPPMHQEFPR